MLAKLILLFVTSIIGPQPPIQSWNDQARTDWAWNGEYVWYEVTPEQLEEFCGESALGAYLQACAGGLTDGSCEVFSTMPESWAHYIHTMTNESLWTHEMKHCQGFSHKWVWGSDA